MAKKNVLGKGLDDLLGDVEQAYKNNLSDHSDRVKDIEISLIKPNPFQPRKVFQEESIRELAESIKEHGLLQPILVYRDENNDYVLIAGERRLRACKLAKKESIRAIVVEIDLAKLRELALIENIQRENLNPIDLAKSYQELLDEYVITHEELAQKIKKSRTQITNTLRLLTLIPEIQEALVAEKITQGHAKVLVGLENDKQKILFDSIVGQKLSVRDTEKMVQSFKKTAKQDIESEKNELVLEGLQKVLKKMNLKIKASSNRVLIDFKNQEEIDFLIEKLVK